MCAGRDRAVRAGRRPALPCILFRRSYAEQPSHSCLFSFIRLVATEQRWILQGLRRSDIAERTCQSRSTSFVAVGCRLVALRTVGARAFELQVVLLLGGVRIFGTRQAREEIDEVVLLRFGESEWSDTAVE